MKLENLKNTAEDRKIRDVVMSAGTSINVYEPTIEDIDTIIDLQQKWVENDDMQIAGIEVIKVLFPMLTDMEGIDDMTDEEISDVVNNPTNALLQIQYHIETIITEVYKTALLKTRKEILDADLSVESYKVGEETIGRTIALSAKNNNTTEKEIIKKIEKANEEYETAVEEEKVIKLNNLVKEEAETKKELTQMEKILAEYQDSFASTDERIDMSEKVDEEDWKGKNTK